MLHSTLEWKYNVILNVHRNYSFNGDYFHTNDVANITLNEQKKYTLLKSSAMNNVGSQLRRKLCAVKPTLANFFDSYNLILSEYFLLTPP